MAIRRPVRRAYRDVRTRLAHLNAELQETISGMAVIQLFGREAARAGELRDLSERYRRAQFRRMGFDTTPLRRRRGGRRDRRGRPSLVGRDRDPRRHAHLRRPRGLHAVHPALLPPDSRRVGQVLGHAGGHGLGRAGVRAAGHAARGRGHGGPGRRGRAAAAAHRHPGPGTSGRADVEAPPPPSSSGTSGSPIRGQGRAGRRVATRAEARRRPGPCAASPFASRPASGSPSSAAPGRGRRRSPGSSRGRTTSSGAPCWSRASTSGSGT